jgi:hypothetical protein
MPTVDANKKILTASASYAADDWATFGAEANLDFRAQAQLQRGIDLGIGAEAGVRIEGGVQRVLSADVQAQANAAARVRGQVQVPLDLFTEAGLAVRLQAVAEASAGVSLAIGLVAGDFLALAEQDPRMRGVPIELLKIFLDELDIEGGVMAKASAAAMAYANLALTGRLIKSGSDLPGFTVAAEAGVGLKAGAGFKVFARFRVADPRRLIRRSVDVAVDGAIEPLLPLVADEAVRAALKELAAPAKIALRCAFELGLTLAENGGTYAGSDGGKIALRCVQTALEEIQRYVLERAVDFAMDRLRAALRDVGFDNARWTATAPRRQALTTRLRALPEEPFEATQHNRDYWIGVIDDAVALATDLAAGSAPPQLREPIALLWSATQLLFVSVQRISEAQARGAILGMGAAETRAPFTSTVALVPNPIRDHINTTLGNTASAPIAQPEIVKFLVRTVLNSPMLAVSPEIEGIVKLVAGPNGDATADALDVVFSNIGAFVPAADGTISAEASLGVIKNALRAYLDQRIEGELRPALNAAAGSNQDLRTFLDEVVISTLHTITGPVFDTVLEWGSGDQDTQRALRELCSSLVFRLLGRSLVVAGDVLLVKAQNTIQDELRQVATHVNDANGVAKALADLTHLDRAFLAEVIEETLLICADTFEPMPDDKRRHVRELLYQIIDTAPAPTNADAVADLRNATMMPNAEAAIELAMLLGEEIVGNVIRFIQALLLHVGALILAELQAVIGEIQKAVEEWIAGLQRLAEDLAQQLAALIQELDRLGRELEDAGDAVLAGASNLLGFIADHTGSRTKLRDALSGFAADRAVGVLRGNDLYPGLPKEARKWARDRVRDIVASLLDNRLFDPALDAVSQIAGETAEFLDDVRAIEPGDDVPVAIANLFLDRFEDAIRDVFGHDDPGLSISIDVPFVGDISFGVSLPLGSLVSALRGAVRDMGRFDSRVAALADALMAMLAKENELRAAEDEHAALEAHRARTERHLADALEPSPQLTILSPPPGAALDGEVMITLRAEGVSQAYLGLEEGEQQRLFVWVNHHELPAAQLQAVVSMPLARPVTGLDAPTGLALAATGMIPISRSLQSHPVIGQRAAGRDRDRAGRSAKLARAGGADRSSAVRAGLLGRAGTVQVRGGSATIAKPVKGGYLPGRTFEAGRLPAFTPSARSTLTITAAIPADFVHDGINTVVCAIVPGAKERRIEQVVSFLLTVAPKPDPAHPVMPGRPVWNKDTVHPDLQRMLIKQFGATRVGTPRATAAPPSVLAQQLWFPRKAARQAAAERTMAAIKPALAAEGERTEQIRQTLKERGFRPVVQHVERPGPVQKERRIEKGQATAPETASRKEPQ